MHPPLVTSSTWCNVLHDVGVTLLVCSSLNQHSLLFLATSLCLPGFRAMSPASASVSGASASVFAPELPVSLEKLCGTVFPRCASGTYGHHCCTLALSRQCPSYLQEWRTNPCRSWTLLANPSEELLRSGTCSVPWLRMASVTPRVFAGHCCTRYILPFDQSGRPLAADWSDIWIRTQQLWTHSTMFGPSWIASAVQSRRKNHASNGSSVWFLLTSTTGTSAHQRCCSPQLLHGCLWRRALTDMFGCWDTSFSLASHAVAQCFRGQSPQSGSEVLPFARCWWRGEVPCGALLVAGGNV